MPVSTRPGPFDDAELQAARALYAPWVAGVLERDLLGRMTPTRRAPFGPIGLELTNTLDASWGADPAFPLNIGADPQRRAIVVPIRTIKWLDEFAGLSAWLQRAHPDQAVVLSLLYANLLVTAPPEGRPPGPLAAFGLDAAIYDDAFVKDVSNKILNGALAFLLLHEIGHLALHHATALSGIASQQQERQADSWALDAMAEMHILPLGVFWLFLSAAMMEGGQTTHPQSGSRIVAVGERLQIEAERFVDRSEPDPARTIALLRHYGDQFCELAPLADDPQRRLDFLRVADGAGFASLRTLLS